MLKLSSKTAGYAGLRYSNKQSGAALLVFLLLVVIAASSLLLNKVNSAIKLSVYNPAPSKELQEAKTALMSWAINHPMNPGTLPMPDRNSDDDYNGDSDCYNGGAIGNNLLLGRLPWRDYPSPCKDSASLSGLGLFPGITSDLGSDKTGRILWYAAAHNLVYESPSYPFISPGIIDKPTGWITVRDSSGAVISDRVAFVLIAPGPALSGYSGCYGTSYAGQDRSGDAPDIENFLDSVTIDGVTYSNADYDQDFISYPNSIVTNDDTRLGQCDAFNDQVVYVTIDELMAAVSKRVLNETANALTTYYNTTGALPGLVPFADPKSDSRYLYGTASSSSNNLVDSTTDFNDWGVVTGDIVWNLDDGSRGIVTSVAANTLTIGAGLGFGTSNTFASGNKYYVETRQLALKLAGDASNGSNGLLLEDAGRDFEEIGIRPGDIIDNLTDSTNGTIVTINGDQLTVESPDMDFDNNDAYRIRSNRSRATTNTDSNSLTLEDTNTNFTVMGLQTGDIVNNLTDGSSGRVTVVNSATQLTVSALALGSTNSFSADDFYTISRIGNTSGNLTGMLPLHRMGEVFPSGFTVDWALGGATITTSLATDSTYTTALSGYAGSSSGYSNTVTVDTSNAACQWLADDTVRCKGLYEDSTATFLSGTATTGSSSLALRDSTKNFTTLGAKRGDKVRNITDGTTGIVTSASSTQLSLANIFGQTAVGIGVGENYKINLATSSFTFSAASPSTTWASSFRVYYPTTVNESLLAVGDTIENVSSATAAVGVISSFNTASNYIVYTSLQGGGYNDIFNFETVRIKHNFVDERQYQFDITLKGTVSETTTGEIRKRAVCKGYNASCTTASNNAAIKGDGNTAFITIRDYENNVVVGQVTNIISIGGLVFRSLRIAGLQYYMNGDSVDLPDWYMRNNWHQYVMVGYDNGDAPGGTQCTAGTDCISVNMINDANEVVSTRDDIRVVVMLAGQELNGQSWANASVSNYFDNNENTDADELFNRFSESDTFNDKIRIATSCPSDATKLCWSN